MKKFSRVVVASSLIAVISAAGAANAAEIRAGVSSFKVGDAGIYVPLSPAVDQAYSVVIQAANTAGYSSTGECTYFNVLKESPTEFQIQHKTCKDGTPIPVDTSVTINWVLMTR
jgi:hypothetical protein